MIQISSKRKLGKFASVFISRCLSSAMHPPVKVQVKQGCVIGSEHTSNGTVFYSYKGIPYAVPPLGELRFKSPIPLERFDTPELDCTKERDVSHQRDAMTQTVIGSENCLFLNVYAPKREPSTQPLPVMVYIHGGGFWFGSGNSDYYFPQRLMEEQVIVVTLNYRLGALGFLCLPEAGIWGNAGLKDQRLALQWVQENIAQFNGNPGNITIFGESAGAASVHLHSYAQHANQLFHKAIMQSGTANMEWVFQADPEYKARRLAELLGCKTSNSKEILSFLQSDKITAHAIQANILKVLTPDERRRGLPLPFKPVIEDTTSPDKFIDTPILELMKRPNTLNIPMIMGYNSGEGMAMTINALKKLTQIDEDLARFVPRNIPLSQEQNKADLEELAEKMRKFYFGNNKITLKQLDALTELLTDYHFLIDLQSAVEWQVELQPNAPLYVFRFDYVGERNFYKRLFQFERLRGACHGDELFYLFQMAADEQPFTPNDRLCVQRLCRLWANFARFGKPTVGLQPPIVDFEWQPVHKPSNVNARFQLDYLALGVQCEMRSDPDRERVEFWRSIYSMFTPIDYSRLSAKL